MSADLTGINNVNDFFTSHYLATYFEENIHDAVAIWKELEDTAGIKSPAAALKQAANQYFVALPNYEAESNQESQMRVVADMAQTVLDALGYKETQSTSIELDEGIEAPIFHEELTKAGKPLLWVLLSNNRDEETSVSEPYIARQNLLT